MGGGGGSVSVRALATQAWGLELRLQKELDVAVFVHITAVLWRADKELLGHAGCHFAPSSVREPVSRELGGQ